MIFSIKSIFPLSWTLWEILFILIFMKSHDVHWCGFLFIHCIGYSVTLLVKKIHALQFWENFIISLIIPIFPFVSKNWAFLPEYRRDGLLAIWGTESIRDLNSLHVDFQPTFLFLCAFNSWAFLGKVTLVGLFLLSFPEWNITEQEKLKSKAVTPHSSAFYLL